MQRKWLITVIHNGSRWDVLRHSRCECLRRLVSCSLPEKQFMAPSWVCNGGRNNDIWWAKRFLGNQILAYSYHFACSPITLISFAAIQLLRSGDAYRATTRCWSMEANRGPQSMIQNWSLWWFVGCSNLEEHPHICFYCSWLMNRWPCVSLAVTTRVAFNDCTGCLGEKSWNLQMDAEHMRLESSAAGYICNIICDKLFLSSYLNYTLLIWSNHSIIFYIFWMYQNICQHWGCDSFVVGTTSSVASPSYEFPAIETWESLLGISHVVKEKMHFEFVFCLAHFEFGLNLT